MIVSASRRTDIPALYGPWFLNRVRAGSCVVPNPFRPSQQRRISLRPQDVDAAVFWTKNPRPFFPVLRELEAMGMRSVFLHTLNAYPRALEPGLPSLARRVEGFKELCGLLGPGRVRWRFDPVLDSSLLEPAALLDAFAALCRGLAPHTDRVIVSFLTLYAKVRRRLPAWSREHRAELRDLRERPEDMLGLAADLVGLAREHGLAVVSCAESADLGGTGIAPAPCIDLEWLNRALGLDLTGERDAHQRPACLCARAEDIGMYDSCSLGCLYCYAVNDHAAARSNRSRHDPQGETLLPVPGGAIQGSLLDMQ